MSTQNPVRLFASDLDGTLLGDDAALKRFQATWDSLDDAQRPLLVYNTARSVADTRWLVLEGRLPSPEFIIGGLGTEVHDPIDNHVMDEYSTTLASGWDRATVEAVVSLVPGIRPQPAEFQGAYKSSWHWHLASAAQVAQLGVRLEQSGLDVVVCYSADVHLDVIPRRAGKGNALAWLCQRIGVRIDEVVVAGISGNNRSMYALPGVRGIVPGNASRELLTSSTVCRPFLTGATYADGVIAGLAHHGVISSAAPDSKPTDRTAASFA